MWNLLARWENPSSKAFEDVTIIAHYYEQKTGIINFIAVDKSGKFINSYMGHFTSQNKTGFIQGDSF